MFLDPQLFSRYSASKSHAMLWRSLLEDAYLFSQPHRYTFNTRTPGERDEAQVFDSTMVKGVINFASKMQSLLTPAGIQWAKLVAGQKIPSDLAPKLNGELEGATKLLFDYLHASNFELAVNESYFDLAVGTAAITCVEGSDDNPLIFNVVPIEMFYPEEGPFGTIETVWRDFEAIPIRNIRFMWPDAVLTTSMQNQMDNDSTATTSLIEGTVFDEEKKNYTYMLVATAEREILFEEVSTSSRWIVFRWSKRATERLGRGPVINALPAALSLNQLARFELKNAALKTAAPLMAFNDGIFNPYNISIEPNTIISVNQPASGAWPIQRLDLGGDVRFTEITGQELREQINSLMFANPLGPINAPAKTATEISIRNQALIEEIGPAFGRLQVEFLPKIIDRAIFILKKKGLFPKIEINGKGVAIEYNSPINQNEEEIEIANFSRYFQTLQATVGPELALGAINLEELSAWLGGRFGVDSSLIKSPQEVSAAIKGASEAAQPPPQEEDVLRGTSGTEGTDLV